MEQSTDPQARAILDFWFGTADSPNYGENREQWWIKGQVLDDRIRDDFQAPYEHAVGGDFDHWTAGEDKSIQAWNSLALILLLDQVPRNIFRLSPKSFASDAKARHITTQVLNQNLHHQLAPIMQVFCYMPLEHSENLEDQNLSVKLFNELGNEHFIDYAISHHRIIQRFGRFPHRNDILGRARTDEELAFLKQPNSSF
jgi:uncharacterized protein (DUF924 family)